MAMCVTCGYDLAGCHPDPGGGLRCPECGAVEPDRVRVTLAPVYWCLWGLTAVPWVAFQIWWNKACYEPGSGAGAAGAFIYAFPFGAGVSAVIGVLGLFAIGIATPFVRADRRPTGRWVAITATIVIVVGGIAGGIGAQLSAAGGLFEVRRSGF